MKNEYTQQVLGLLEQLNALGAHVTVQCTWCLRSVSWYPDYRRDRAGRIVCDFCAERDQEMAASAQARLAPRDAGQ